MIWISKIGLLEEALNAVKFLGWLKKFGPAKNVLGPVKGQGINLQLKKDTSTRFEKYFA